MHVILVDRSRLVDDTVKNTLCFVVCISKQNVHNLPKWSILAILALLIWSEIRNLGLFLVACQMCRIFLGGVYLPRVSTAHEVYI